MSFDIFVGCFAAGHAATLPTAMLETVFGPYIVRKRPDVWNLQYAPDDRTTIYFGKEDVKTGIKGFMVSSPPGSPLFWSGLLNILQRGNAALYWPGTRVIIVGGAWTIPGLPPEMINDLGPPVVVVDPDEILKWIKRS